MTKTESANRTVQAVVIEACEQLLECWMAEGCRLAIPNTNNLIMVGPQEWIAKNVPGVEAMVAELPTSVVTDGDSARAFVDAWHREHFPTDRTFSRYIMGRDRHCALAGDFAWQLAKALESLGSRLAATTQASTAQAEPGSEQVKHGDVPSIEITLRQAKALVDCFGGNDAEISIIRRPAAWADMADGLYAYFSEYPEEGSMYLGETEVQDEDEVDAATSSTDAQAAAEVRDAALDEAALLCEQIGTDWLDADDAHKQFAADYLAKAIRALRAGDTGEQADGGAHG